ncbi:MAG: DNA translocase FtsK 4TM domain-containing protein [Candidatus Nomurabacteria bacterium]|jgi:S-DNA-T family DNA segregation ATPase FtsK/SpoIIIE|nr:DNA translocase FtsK 4TM domain-containing protein [Candidatus Nomurabacteria bacterium]
MAKKRKRSQKLGKSASKEVVAEHNLPGGFWRQVGALLMIAVAVLFVVSWFGAGGAALKVLHDVTTFLIGYATYLLPVLLVYLAVAVFRSENNRIHAMVIVASMLFILWFAGVFGLFKGADGAHTGGVIGIALNKGMLAIADETVAVFLYILLILITALFLFRVSPIAIFKKIYDMMKTGKLDDENDKNAKMADKVKELSDKKQVKPVVNTPFKANGTKAAEPTEASQRSTSTLTPADPNWKLPPLSLLSQHETPPDPGDTDATMTTIENTFDEFDIKVDMRDINVGPKVTQYTLMPPRGVKLTKITELENNIRLNLAAEHIRMEAPIPGKQAVGIEVPNVKSASVGLHSMIESHEWKKADSKLSFAVGMDIAGKSIIEDLGEMPHLLIAGQTKSGKSVMINTMLCSLLYRNSPSDLKLIMVDPKIVELSRYNDIPHLLTEVITDTEKTVSALKWAVREMEKRYKMLAEKRVVNIDGYNEAVDRASEKKADDDEALDLPPEEGEGKMPSIVIVIDEMADLMMAAPKDLESLIVRLAQKARAVGIHLVLATQSPRADVITGLIKANIPATIAFTVRNYTESGIILGQNGAESLLGKGDMLLLTSAMPAPKRIQGALVTNGEVQKITDYLREQSPPQYNDDVTAQPVHIAGKNGVMAVGQVDEEDPLFRDAVQLGIDSGGKISASMIQTRLRLGFSRAKRIIMMMEDKNIIGPPDGNRPRDILISDIADLDGGGGAEY